MTRKQTNSRQRARSRKPGRQEPSPHDSAPSARGKRGSRGNRGNTGDLGDLGELGAAIRRTRAKGQPVSVALSGSPKRVPLPDPIATLVADALDAFARGHRVELAVQTVPSTAGKSRPSADATCHYLILDRDPSDEITTQEAAQALRVSRPTIIKAIEEGRLAARKVGKHRRVRIYDFNAYAQAEHAARVAHAMESDRIEQELGLYEIPLPPSRAAWKSLLAQPQKKQSARASRRGGR